MNQIVPLGALKRDELYSFLGGLLIASIWYVLLENIGILTSKSFFTNPAFFMLWLLGTAVMWLLYVLLSNIILIVIQNRIKQLDHDTELAKMGLQKRLSFFHSTSIEEMHIQSHIIGIITTSMILIYYPAVSFVGDHFTFTQFIIIHISYTGFCLSGYFLFFVKTMEIVKVNTFIRNGYCDLIDYKKYIEERASHFASVKNREYEEILAHEHRKNS
ncbi:hypothetical protein [Desulfuromonas sp. AOP6]|uniref:hypothetical protein n=1 Tax=Desulfuromonas sp. AOP6 TaxID=1566351 RepID=UPI00127D9A45|nr:hypothetical protein [Desulfuromonas sp. AOP6]BCA80951.1 hypothetical protein AOP6_2738 [Desulfuromonas sp. AOP6]